ncbi:MAG: tetratricopeptide repeat protein [Candidatus Kryptoniota bacterium]
MHSQTLDELNKFRIAQALEGAGEYARAIDFYQELYHISPGNVVYFDGLRRCYMQLKRYDEAVELIKSRIAVEPDNVVLYGELGDALYKAGKTDSAMTVWRMAISLNKGNPEVYRTVANFMVESRLFDKAIEVLKEGESVTHTPVAFAPEIARLYVLTTDYRDALGELLKMLESQDHSSALAYIESQIGMYSSSKEAMSQFADELERRVKDSPDNVDIRRLLAFVYMETRDYSSAYKVYKWLDLKSHASGMELMNFANQAYNDEAYDVSANAYKEVASLTDRESVVPAALIGYANSIFKIAESLNKNEDDPCKKADSLSLLAEAEAVYVDLAKKYPGTDYAGTAVLNAVKIRMNYFDDIKGAKSLLNELSKSQEARFKSEQDILKLQIGLREGSYDSVVSAGEDLLGSTTVSGEPFFDRVKLDIGLALFYMGRVDSAAKMFSEISSNPMSDVANEALYYLGIMRSNSSARDALVQYALASGMIQSGRVPEGILILNDIVKKFPHALLADNVRLKLAEAYCQVGDLTNSIRVYGEIAGDSTGVFADIAQFRLGLIYQDRLKDSKKAIEVFEDFLRRFPDSIYQDKVRKKIIGLMSQKKEVTG